MNHLSYYAVVMLIVLFGVELYRDRVDSSQRWSLGITLGIAVSIIALYGLLTFGLDLKCLFFMLLLGLAFSLVRTFRGLKQPPFTFTSEAATLGIVLSAVAISRLALTFAHDLPPGWDSSFHLILAKKMYLSGRLATDWLPFRNTTLNYPVGSHALISFLTKFSGLELHHVFASLQALLGVLSTLQIFVLAKKLTASYRIGIFSALSYGMWALFGSIDYYRWGGLPNQMAMCLWLSSLILLTQKLTTRREQFLFGILVAAIPLTHHHVFLSSSLIFIVYFLVLLFQRDYDFVKRLGLGLLLAALFSSFYTLPYALKALTLQKTGVLNFQEDLLAPLFVPESLGFVFFVAAIWGCFLCWRNRQLIRDSTLFYCYLGVLLSLFILLGYVNQLVTYAFSGKAYTIFTPSRFLTDAVYFLAIPVGLTLAAFQDRYQKSLKWMVVAGLILGLSNWEHWRSLARKVIIPPELLLAYQWIGEHAADDVVLCNQEALWRHQGIWATYLTWHPTGLTPAPISEPIELGESLEKQINTFCETKTRGDILGERPVWDVVPIAERGASKIVKEIAGTLVIVER